MQILIRTIQGSAGVLTYTLRMFALCHLIIDVGLGLLLAIGCFAIAADGSILRGVLAAIVALVATGFLGTILAFNVAVSLGVARAVREAQLGTKVLQALLDEINSGSLEKLDGLKITELENKLNSAAKAVIADDDFPVGLAGVSQWLANRIERVVIWATVRVVISQCSSGEGEDRVVDFGRLQELLSGKIDAYIIDLVRSDVRRLSLSLAGAVVSLSALVAYGISKLPI